MRYLLILVAGAILSTAALPSDSMAREMASLYERFSAMKEVKVFVSDITDSTQNKKTDLAALKKELENAFVTRRSLKFRVVNAREEADIAIGMNVTEFYWTSDDPIDMVMGVGGVVMDAMKKENYGRIQTIISVTDVKKNREIWNSQEKATITDKQMTEQDSVKLLNERIVKIFIRDCFSKSRSK
ncbi:MAG: hypothetical protein HQL30_00785 [Candidatus Omnitrophica bacterium]|nr:hypothetical protein [Candidatus Omnitrophota bacterium]